MNKLSKLRCRNCNSIIELPKKDEEKSCNCGNCTINIKSDKVYIGSKQGVGDYTLYNSEDEEYVLITKKELEEING